MITNNHQMKKKSLLIAAVSLSFIDLGLAQHISGGNNHSLFFCPDSSAWGVGNNSRGALGDGTTAEK